MENRGNGSYDQAVLKLTYSIARLVKGLESRLTEAKECELFLFGYQISTMISLLVRLHTQIHNKQIAHSFISERRRIPLDITSETYAHVLASIAPLSELVKKWAFPHQHLATLIEDHLSQLQAFYLVEDRSNQKKLTHEEVSKLQPVSAPLPPPLLASAARIRTHKKRKSVRPKPVAKVVKVRTKKKMQAKRVTARPRPPYLSNSVKVRIGNVTKIINI
ncbi:hypothetical protein [Brevibacillus sp. 179-C 1.1 NHS]|uniref:hypothetical protein n=1 Tax=Brevibacillus sp. 179-C 1.1 NHS TaxID=3235177 RepID=UPI0039A20578